MPSFEACPSGSRTRPTSAFSGTGSQLIGPAANPEPEFRQAPDIDWENGRGIPGFDGEESTKKLELMKQEMLERP